MTPKKGGLVGRTLRRKAWERLCLFRTCQQQEGQADASPSQSSDQGRRDKQEGQGSLGDLSLL